jgi:hypothetical protein
MAQGASWLEKEDAQLAQGWLHTSQNPIFANSMKHDQFWEKEAKHFNENCLEKTIEMEAASKTGKFVSSLFQHTF